MSETLNMAIIRPRTIYFIFPALKFCTHIEALLEKGGFHKSLVSPLMLYVADCKQQVTVDIIKPVTAI